MDLSTEEGLKRAEARGAEKSSEAHQQEDRYERMGMDFHERLREGFLYIARKNRKRCVVVDANRPIEDIHEDIRKIVFVKFGLATDE